MTGGPGRNALEGGTVNLRWIAVAVMLGVLVGACVWGALLLWGAS